MIIGLTDEQRARLEVVVQTYYDELLAITNEIMKDCKTAEDVEMAHAVITLAIEQASKKIQK